MIFINYPHEASREHFECPPVIEVFFRNSVDQSQSSRYEKKFHPTDDKVFSYDKLTLMSELFLHLKSDWLLFLEDLQITDEHGRPQKIRIPQTLYFALTCQN